MCNSLLYIKSLSCSKIIVLSSLFSFFEISKANLSAPIVLLEVINNGKLYFTTDSSTFLNKKLFCSFNKLFSFFSFLKALKCSIFLISSSQN